MNWSPSAFGSDVVILTWWDLVKLACGCRLKDGACEVRLGFRPGPLRLSADPWNRA